MICGATCFIALIFLAANIFTMISCTNDNYKQEFKNTLSNEQNILYEKIVDERKKIYFMGYGLGILLSVLTIYFNKYLQFLPDIKNKNYNTSLVCLVGAITFITNYLFYILYPKSDYMLLHLSDKTQIQGWLEIYKKMQFKFHLGFVLGIIAVMIFSYSFCK
jgi:hypothetical protein